MPANTQPLSRSHFSDLDRRDTQPGMKFNFRSLAYTHKRDMHDQKTKQPPDDTSPTHRSPLRFSPLHGAGQSVADEITRLSDEFNDKGRDISRHPSTGSGRTEIASLRSQ